MKNGKKLMCMALALCMMVSLAAPAFAAGAEEKRCAVVSFEDGADVNKLCGELESLPGVRVKWTYETLFKGAAIEGAEADLAAAAKCGGVAEVYRSRLWNQPYAEGDPAGTSNSLDVMRGEDIAYDGDGMVIAVIDSGFYVSHETFKDHGTVKTPALSEEEIDAFVDEGGTDGRYISQKVPFAYDYNGQDRSVHTSDTHGTHVAALAAGYATDSNGVEKFRGVAPAAQMLFMKVFPDRTSGGASDADILKALEDAFLLGADVVNLSLGSEGDLMEGSDIGTLYAMSILKMREAGVVICCAAGNSGNALTDKAENVAMPTADYTDYGTACLPAAFPGAVSVGAVNSLTREGGGGLLVKDMLIQYIKSISENEEEVLPDLDDLAGQKLTYVMVGGIGAKSDFEGLDLTGCVAVVKRGEIYFTEKVNNAAAAGAVACLIYNNEDVLILPAVQGTTIPCALITLEAGEYMAEQAVDGRGEISVEPDNVMVGTGEPLSMLEASSWGATSDLRLLPTLSAPGGAILSAVNGAQNSYGYLSGTSMAAPNASGAFAVLMQALNERGIDDRKARAELAENLLMSTAALVTDEDGTPLSPRRQGAGVIDLAAALESRAVIEDPILETGDGLNRTIRLSFTVKNLSDEELCFAVEPRVLTDGFGYVGEQVYNTLTPLEISKYMKISGTTEVKVGSGKTQTVRLMITADEALIKTLDEVYPNGFFMEGYVALKENGGTTVHATFMGYHGDWEAAPVIEQVDFRDMMEAIAAEGPDAAELTEVLPVNMWYNMAYLTGGSENIDLQFLLGENRWAAVVPNDQRIAMSTANCDAHTVGGRGFAIDLFTLRHAAHVIMIVSDKKTGEVYYVDDTPNLPRADYDAKAGIAINTGWFAWNGTDSAGKPLPDGTEAEVRFFAWVESDRMMQTAYKGRNCDMTRPQSYRWLLSGLYNSALEWMFPVVLDGTSPVTEATMNVESGEITLTVTDEQFLAYASVQDSVGNVLLEETFAGEKRGETHVLTFTLPEGNESSAVYLTLSDYASNTVGYSLDVGQLLSEESVDAARCPVAMFNDMNRNAWYHEAVDFVCEEGLMVGIDVASFRPVEKVSRATVVDVLHNMAGRPEAKNPGRMPFTDVQFNMWYYDSLLWAYEQGVATGDTETTFAALAPVTRQQLAVMFYRAAQLDGEVPEADVNVLGNFTDGAEVSTWATEAMAWAVSEGILSGDSAGKLNPLSHTTRAELAQIITNILKKD